MLVQSLGQEDPLEEEMATQSGILAWKILWTEKPSGLQSMGLSRQENGVGCYSLLRGIFLTQRLNLGLLPYRKILYHLSH